MVAAPVLTPEDILVFVLAHLSRIAWVRNVLRNHPAGYERGYERGYEPTTKSA